MCAQQSIFMDCAGYEQPLTSKRNETDNNQVDILLQDMGIPRKEVLALATKIQSNILKWEQ